LFGYRHYSFTGSWNLKDQGVIEAGAAPVRELFLVLPEDLIEFKLSDSDCYAKVEIKKLGYIKTGTVKELLEWLAFNSYMEKAGLSGNDQIPGQRPSAGCLPCASRLDQACRTTIGHMLSIGRTIGLPFLGY